MSQGKRWFNRLVFTVFLGSLSAVPFYLPGPNGQPMLQVRDFIPALPDFSQQLARLQAGLASLTQHFQIPMSDTAEYVYGIQLI